MSTLRKTEAHREKARAALAEAEQAVAAAQGRRPVACKHCGKRCQIRRLIFIRTYWYERPYGCTGGDSWNHGEGQYVCPACLRINRMCEFNGRLWLDEYEDHFSLTVDKHNGGYSTRELAMDDDEVEKFTAEWRRLYRRDVDVGAIQ